MNYMKYIFLLLPLLIVGCGHMSVPIDRNQFSEKQGVVVTSSRLITQSLLPKEGAHVSIDNQAYITIPWGSSKFIALDTGEHSYNIWFKYYGRKAGGNSGCLIVKNSTTVLLEYKSPLLITSSGDVQTSALTGNTYKTTCAPYIGASKEYPPIPEDINRKGYFKIPTNIIEKNKITKVITNDFIYEDNGKLTKRNRQHVLTYNNGDLTSSSGHKDQSGDVSYKYIYDKKRNLIEEYQYRGLNITVEPSVKILYKNIGAKNVSKEIFNNEGVLLGRETFKYDKNNNSEISIVGGNNQLRYKIIKNYDVFNNLIVRKKSNITSYYSYRDNIVTILVKLPDGTIHSSHKYAFNKNNTIDSYLRTSGDGGYWDKYIYSYNENGLPISKVHSKKEFIIQDPYELTKYEYVK